MMHTTTQFRSPRSARSLRPVFGLAAAFAAAATLGLAVVAPSLSAPAAPAVVPHVDAAARPLVPTEVAILPGTIEVVATRTRTARAASPYLPAAYRPRG
ncbi:MAG: hypothetical protein U1F58_16000 [Burkholderiales bacterium]